MTKLFIQLMLSVIVGLGAAMGFSPKVRTGVHDTVLQASASLHETASAAVTNANKVTAKISTAVSVKENADASSNISAKADLHLKNDLKAKLDAGDTSPIHVLPGWSLNPSLTNEAQTSLEVNGSSLDVRVKDEAKSTLNLNLGAGK